MAVHLFPELISLEVPLANPLHIPVTLNDVRLLWQFSEGDNSDQHHVSSNCQLGSKEDSPYVITYVTPRLLFDPSSSQKVNDDHVRTLFSYLESLEILVLFSESSKNGKQSNRNSKEFLLSYRVSKNVTNSLIIATVALNFWH